MAAGTVGPDRGVDRQMGLERPDEVERGRQPVQRRSCERIGHKDDRDQAERAQSLEPPEQVRGGRQWGQRIDPRRIFETVLVTGDRIDRDGAGQNRDAPLRHHHRPSRVAQRKGVGRARIGVHGLSRRPSSHFQR